MKRVTFSVEKNGEYEDVELAEGSALLEAALKYRAETGKEALLAVVDGRLAELFNPVQEGSHVRFLTATDHIGMQTYERTLIMLLLKALHDCAPGKKTRVQFSLNRGYYIEIKNDSDKVVTPSEKLIADLKAQMDKDINSGMPVLKTSVKTSEAMELFEKQGMLDKVELFQNRRDSYVNIYSLGDYKDYFYGYMATDLSVLKVYDVRKYDRGIALLLPDKQDPTRLAELKEQSKVFGSLQASTKWGEIMKVATVGELNQWIAAGKASELILVQEALQEQEIASLAMQIKAKKRAKFIMIAGPSSSGKTSFSYRLSIQLRAHGLTPHPIGLDDYFKNRADTPKNPDGSYDFEGIGAVDIESFNRDMTNLLAGETVEMPYYNFKTGHREYNGNYLRLGPEDVLVIEGIHGLNDQLSYSLPAESKFRIYVSALTQLNVDEHNRISTSDGRLLRRIVRDSRSRGHSAEKTIAMWPSVRRGEEQNIFPVQENADVVFNSSLIYELSVLKSYAEPLLFAIPRTSEQYFEARRLLKFLSYFLPIPSEDIPHNSLLREFVGGSIFNV